MKIYLRVRYEFHPSAGYPRLLLVRLDGEKGESRTSYKTRGDAMTARAAMAKAFRAGGHDVRFSTRKKP